ncbi:hypothetical protein [Streptomyces similanensis]|uniref:Uncharacterized protein n=1 Tax=Streptomyces similanensis TaxID=1274988 RepID=A0ABP9L7I4_9ACTN
MATAPQQPQTGIKNADELLTLARAYNLTVTIDTKQGESLTSHVVNIAIPVPAAHKGTELGRTIAAETLTLLWTKPTRKGTRGRLDDATTYSVDGSRKLRTLRAVTNAVDFMGREAAKYAREAAPLPEDVIDAPFPVQPAPAADPYNALQSSLSAADMSSAVYDVTATKGDAVSGCPAQEGKRLALAVGIKHGMGARTEGDADLFTVDWRGVEGGPGEIVHTFRRRTETTEETPAPAADERQHVRITNDGPAEIIPTRQALDEINAAKMQPEVKRTVKRMSASKSTAHIVYRDGRTVYLRPATPDDVFPTPTERPTDAELTGEIDAELAAYYAETFQAVADGSALPVRADMIQPGMDVIHAHMDETRTINAVTSYVGPGAPWVRPTWTFRSHDESTTGSTFPPEMHLMVTRASLDTVFGPAPVEDADPAAPVDEKTRHWAEGFAAKWWAEQNTGEPTNAALAAVFAHTVKPPKQEAYPLIREAITALTPPAAAAPLFAAHAAREAAEKATDLAPASLHRLVNHLEALPLAAPPARHVRLRAARDTAEGAWESLRAARNLPAKTAARSAAKDAIVRARAAILAVQPHASRMHGTDMPATADEIRAAALAYTAVGGTPDERSAIVTGTPKVLVRCASDSGTGGNVTAEITAGVDSPLGHIPAHPPIVLTFRKTDDRENARVNAYRAIGRRFLVGVPVEYTDHRP